MPQQLTQQCCTSSRAQKKDCVGFWEPLAGIWLLETCPALNTTCDSFLVTAQVHVLWHGLWRVLFMSFLKTTLFNQERAFFLAVSKSYIPSLWPCCIFCPSGCKCTYQGGQAEEKLNSPLLTKGWHRAGNSTKEQGSLFSWVTEVPSTSSGSGSGPWCFNCWGRSINVVVSPEGKSRELSPQWFAQGASPSPPH